MYAVPLTISFNPGVTSVGANFFVTGYVAQGPDVFPTLSGTITLTLSDGSSQSFYTNTANSFGGFVSHGAFISSITIATSNDFVTVDNLVVSTGTINACVSEELNLTINHPSTTTETIVACGSYNWHGNTYTASNNTATWTGQNAAGCDSTVTLNLTINPLPTPAISGTLAFCAGGSTTLDAGAGYSSYLWSTGASTQTIAVSNTTPVSVTVTNAAGCSATSASVTPTANAVSTAPTSITSSVAFATVGVNFTLSVNGGSLGTGASWKWYTGSCGGTLIGTGASISVSQTANTTYFVRAEGTCNTTACATVTVNIACVPQSVSASSTIVCLGSSTTLNVQGNLTAGASWKWYSGSCGTTLVGTGASISVTPTTTTNYFVRSEGGACGTTTCLSIAIQVRTIPSTPQGIIVPNQVCRNAMNTFSVQNPIAGLTYTWVVPSGWSITSGQGTATINVMVGQNNGQVSVKASNSCGSSALFNRSVGPINCRRSEEVDADAGIESARTEETVETLLTATDALNAIAVYPNPTTGEARITFSTTAAGKYALSIVDLQGRVINSTSGAAIEGNNTLDINLSNCSNGVYMIHLMHNDTLQTLRVVKM